MSASNTSSTRICPVCDAPNSAFSLFCAECGASLNTTADGDTAAYEPVSSSSSEAQDTTAFTPAAPRQPTSTVTPYAPRDNASAPTNAWTAPHPVIHFDASDQPGSMRGFYLGLLAALLILAVFLLWTWAALLDASTRESIRDLFGFIG